MQCNKYMYINQELLNSNQIHPKVLINPNFMKAAPVKPHFNKQFLSNTKIHVNPNILNVQHKARPQPKPDLIIPKKPIVSTRTKLIRVPEKSSFKASPSKSIITSQPYKRRSIHTQYKIIRTPILKRKQKQDAHIKKLFYVKNRFAIDHRKQTTRISPKFLNRSLNNNLKTKNVYVKCNSKLNAIGYVSINGILYKKSPKSLVTVNHKSVLPKKNRQKEQFKMLTIRGQKYQLDSNHRTLTLMPKKNNEAKLNFKTIYLGGVAFKQKDANVFIKTNINQNRRLISQVKQRSIQTLRKRLKKSNIPCPFYRKFGACKGKENGTCIRVHNPDQISLCPKFLQGACVNNKCCLSHKVSSSKMPTCKFYLHGLCSKDNCPYLHVKISPTAEICKDFLEGFCRKAVECEKRHQFLCPDFEKSGSCPRRKCNYPHGNLVRKTKVNKKLAPKLQTNRKSLKSSTKSLSSSNLNTNSLQKSFKDLNKDHIDIDKANNGRYYDDVHNTKVDSGKIEIIDLDTLPTTLKDRPDLGTLPSFIPFADL